MAETPTDEPPAFSASDLMIRDAVAEDISRIVALDALNTDIPKPEYWDDTFARFGSRAGRYFLSAEQVAGGEFLGFIVGEVRAWEFGSPPCGWILTIGVMPEHRVRGVGALLFDAICERLPAESAGHRHRLACLTLSQTPYFAKPCHPPAAPAGA